LELHVPEMEPTMINRKLLSAAAVMALVLPFALPTESFAQHIGGARGGVAAGGGGGYRGGAVGGGGGFRASGVGGGAAMAGPRFAQGGVGGRSYMASPRTGNYSGVIGQGGARVSSGSWQGGSGNWQGGNGWNGGYRHHRGGGFWPGVAVGAAIGGSYAYYGGPGYYDQGYYDDGYYDSGVVAAVPAEGGDASWCAQTYRSYDPASGTYLGYDGQRHPCP
jgi:hypothetical protein